MRGGKRFHKRKGEDMNPAIVTAATSLIGRFLDKNKKLGLTNLTTAGGTGIIYLGYIMMDVNDDFSKWVGVGLMCVGAAVTLIKEYKE